MLMLEGRWPYFPSMNDFLNDLYLPLLGVGWGGIPFRPNVNLLFFEYSAADGICESILIPGAKTPGY
jgi:hypothetical protein